MAEDLEIKLQKQVIAFYKSLKSFMITWDHNIDNEIIPTVNALLNQVEQINYVEKYNLINTDYEKFPALKERLFIKITDGIEEELMTLQKQISLLNTTCQELKTKAVQFENFSQKLDWSLDSESKLIKGCALQRPLSEILQWACEIIDTFKSIIANIFEYYKSINYRESLTVKKFKQCFFLDAKFRSTITNTLAYLQFCENI